MIELAWYMPSIGQSAIRCFQKKSQNPKLPFKVFYPKCSNTWKIFSKMDKYFCPFLESETICWTKTSKKRFVTKLPRFTFLAFCSCYHHFSMTIPKICPKMETKVWDFGNKNPNRHHQSRNGIMFAVHLDLATIADDMIKKNGNNGNMW